MLSCILVFFLHSWLQSSERSQHATVFLSTLEVGQIGIKQYGLDQCWIHDLVFLFPVVQVINLRAVAPVAKWPIGVFVLSSHTENILILFDIDLVLCLLSGVQLHKRTDDTLKTMQFNRKSASVNLIYIMHVLITNMCVSL